MITISLYDDLRLRNFLFLTFSLFFSISKDMKVFLAKKVKKIETKIQIQNFIIKTKTQNFSKFKFKKL